MPRISEKQVGSVFLKEVARNRWRASYTDPLTRKHIRRMLPASTYEDAHKQAKGINAEVSAGRGFGGRMRGSSGHMVSDAVLEAVKHSDANQRTRKHYLNLYNSFAAYLDENAKGIRSWNDVTETVIQNYIEHCRRASLAYDTIRLRISVLRLTGVYMARTYPGQCRNVFEHLKVKRHNPPKAELEEENAILCPETLSRLLAWLGKKNPMVHVWATLQGLCGLRLMEAAYLRELDFDAAAGTIMIRETSAHRPKNRHSYRTIPICPEAVSVLSRWILAMKVRHPEGYLFTPSVAPMGRPGAKTQEARVGAFTQDTVKQRWALALSEIRTAPDPNRELTPEEKADFEERRSIGLPPCFVAHRLRASFATAMRKAGADYEVLQTYLGHAPATILSAHYDRIDLERLKGVSRLAQAMLETARNGGEEATQEVGHLH